LRLLRDNLFGERTHLAERIEHDIGNGIEVLPKLFREFLV
jgi:hypothetical protein